MDEKELWRPYPVGDKTYLVSNLGKVKRPQHTIKFHHYGKLKQRINPELEMLQHNFRGYRTVPLYGSKKRYHRTVHRMVAQCFIPNPENKSFVNHKNGIKNDNRVENLEWCTAKENAEHAVSIGLYKRGETHGRAKLNESQVKKIRSAYSNGETQTSLAKKYKMGQQTISQIILKKIWR